MNNCAHCQSETNNLKFCSRSCLAKSNNTSSPKRKKLPRSREEIEQAVSNSKSYSGALSLLGLRAVGGNFGTLQRYLEKYDIDTSHMLHQGSNKGRIFKPFEGLTSNEAIKKRLIAERGYCCEGCNLDTWLGLPIALELEHIDGNNRNGDRSNLKLLCHNCHAQTPTWRNRKR